MFIEWCRRLAGARSFQRAILALILVNAVLMGLETSSAVKDSWGWLILPLEHAIQAVFVIEILVRLAAHGSRPLAFFRDGWNVFDLAVVALSLLPVAGPFATVARLARVLRVARLVSALPELRLIVGTMLRSIPSMGHVIVLLGLLVYVYAILGFHLFGKADPAHWGTLGRAVRSLFIIMTLEGWVEILETAGPATAVTWAFYASFIVVAVFVVINLFIAVVINNLEAMRAEEAPAEGRPDAAAADVLAGIRDLRARLDRLEARLAAPDAGAAAVPAGDEPGVRTRAR